MNAQMKSQRRDDSDHDIGETAESYRTPAVRPLEPVEVPPPKPWHWAWRMMGLSCAWLGGVYFYAFAIDRNWLSPATAVHFVTHMFSSLGLLAFLGLVVFGWATKGFK